MNWNRGLHHIYLVLALGWILYVLVLLPLLSHNQTIHDYYAQHEFCMESLPLTSPNYQKEQKKCDDILAVELAVFGNNPWADDRRAPLIPLFRAFLPPLVLYVVGGVIVWFVYRGFRK